MAARVEIDPDFRHVLLQCALGASLSTEFVSPSPGLEINQRFRRVTSTPLVSIAKLPLVDSGTLATRKPQMVVADALK